MRYRTLALAAALGCLPALGMAQPVPTPTTSPAPALALTLARAQALARAANPALQARQAQLAAAEGQAADAAALLANNPQLSADQTRRSVPAAPAAERRTEWGAGISQTFEIAGQQGHRREAANAALRALQLEIDDALRQLRAEVADRFYRVLALQQRAEVEAQALQLFENTARAVERRRSAGEDTRLDANVSLVEAERARNQVATVQEQLLDARAALAGSLQLPAAELPQASGELGDMSVPFTREDLLRAASEQPRLQALSAREQSAQARLALQRAARYPDVTVGLNVGREGPNDGRERLTTLTLSVPLPLFQRNGAAVGQASSDLAATRIERRAAERDVPAQVHMLWARLQSLQARVDRLQRSVLPALADNERLSVKSLRAGQIGLLELIVTHRQALDARRDLIDAQLDYQTTKAALEAAAGWNAQP